MDKQKALEWLTDVLSVQGGTLTLTDTRNTVPEWDSMGTLLILSRLEEDHGLVVGVDELAALDSIREICDLLSKSKSQSD